MKIQEAPLLEKWKVRKLKVGRIAFKQATFQPSNQKPEFFGFTQE